MQRETYYRPRQLSSVSPSRRDFFEPHERRRGRFSFAMLALIVGVGIAFAIFHTATNNVAAAASSVMHSGISGYCLEDYENSMAKNNKVISSSCDNSQSQSWSVRGDTILHDSMCLSVQGDGTSEGAHVVANACSNSPGQVWLRDKQSYFNPNSGMCLTAPQQDEQLTVSSCNESAQNQMWSLTSLDGKSVPSASCRGSEGEKVACYAEQEWTAWQSGRTSHADLLNKYTDQTADEAWCADFVSYVYKEAGDPFTQAYDGWDESNADSVQNYNFTLHDASSNYVPQPGDVAYFNYPGGHVEIVVSGGQTPTFVYGDSATPDPETGNGNMEANTITSDGQGGQLMYYLTPNS